MKKLTLLSFFFLTLSLNATHNRSGEILYKRIAPFTNLVGNVFVQVYTYSITVIKYTDDGPGVADRCVDTVYFGDGNRGVAPRINGSNGSCQCGFINSNAITCGSLIVNDPSYKVKLNIYSIIHTYSGLGTYLIHTSDPNRNQGIHNIPNSGNLPFYLESQVIINIATGTNSSPVFTNPPTDQGVLGTCLYLNWGTYDADGDSLSYEISTARGGDGNAAPGYFEPESGANGTFSINAVTGLLTWCTPQFVAEYDVTIIVKEWRRISCNSPYTLLGYVLRDMQVLIKPGTSAPFSSSSIVDTCVIAGATVLKNLNVTSSNVNVILYGGTETFTSSPASINPTSVSSTTVLNYQWNTLCSQAREQPYDIQIVCQTSGSVKQKFYSQFRITVVPPTPVMASPIIDTGAITLTWNSLYFCLPNLAGYNIYRKTGTNNWTHSACQQGVPANSGFVMVGVVSPTATSFKDVNMWQISNGTIGNYIVTAFTNDCAESFADNALTLTLIVGLKENELEKKLRISPNPFNEKLDIDLGPIIYDHFESSVYSIEGKLVFKSENKNVSGKINLELDFLKAGLYTLIIKTETGVMQKKIVKE